MKFAVIVGTGYRDLNLELVEKRLSTPYGETTLYIYRDSIVILPRHLMGHKLPPHRINYRANIYALKALGVEFIYGICAVGSLREEYAPGGIVLIDDFLDMTKNRACTFFDGKDSVVKHLEVSNVYNKKMNELFINHSRDLKIYGSGVYVCTEGPRFESAAEIKFYSALGCSVVGMTNIPESILAAELNINYACISYITNFCTGIGKISHEDFSGNSNLTSEILNCILDCFNDESILKTKEEHLLL